jgi:hypothetical protein
MNRRRRIGQLLCDLGLHAWRSMDFTVSKNQWWFARQRCDRMGCPARRTWWFR